MKPKPSQNNVIAACSGGRRTVTAIIVVMGTAGFLAPYGLLLWTVHRLKPARFQVKASITRSVSLGI